jgi:hypothetical protein
MRLFTVTLCSLATLVICDFRQVLANSSPNTQEVITNEFSLTQVPLGEPEPAIPDENQPLDSEDVENELGEINIISPSQQPSPRRQPNVQLLLRSSAFTSSNISALEFSQPSDTVFINSASLLATPKLSEDTRLVAAVSGGLARYADKGDFNYNFLNYNVGVQQRIAPGMYGQLGWVQDRVYRDENGKRLLLDDSIRLSVGRQDQLDNQIRLDSFYELRASFATPNDQSRVANTLGARLRYDISPKLQTALDYRLTLKDFTQQERFDTQHQLSLETIYSINQDLFIGGSASYLFGSSSDTTVDLDNFSIGINLGLNLPLF